MTDEQREFIELYSFEKKNYPDIEDEMNIDRRQLLELRSDDVKAEIKRIQHIYTKFTGKRKDEGYDFKEFHDWYEDQDQKCGYCDVEQEDLYQIFKKFPEKGMLPYLDPNNNYKKAPKRSSGTLEIERLDSSGSYELKNMILACPLCNNAKSNLIDEDSWCKLFVPAMKMYYKKLLQSKIVTD